MYFTTEVTEVVATCLMQRGGKGATDRGRVQVCVVGNTEIMKER